MIRRAGGQHSILRSFTGLAVYVALVLTVAVTMLGSSAQALDDPLIDTTAPTASITLSAPEVTTGRTIVVSFDETVVADEAENLLNYFVINPQPGFSYDNLVGYATATYDPLMMQTTITLTDDSWLVWGEGLTWGVRDVHDLAGNSLESTTYSGVAMVAPTVPGIPTATSATNNTSITWVWSPSLDEGEYPSGIASYSYELTKDGVVVDSGTVTGDVLTVVTSVTDDGTYVLTLRAIDRAGNISEAVVGQMVIDATPPAVTVDGSTMTGNTAQPVVNGESEGLTYSWTTTSPSSDVVIDGAGTRTPVVTVLRDGTYTFTLTVTDGAENVTIQSFTIAYAFPFVPPAEESELVVELVPYIVAPARVVSASARDMVAYSTVAVSEPTVEVDVAAPIRKDDTKKVSSEPKLEALETQAAMSGVIFAPTAQGWRILGLLWYWWAAIVVIIFAGWKWLRYVRDARD